MKPSDPPAMLETVLKTISRHRMLESGDRVIAAVSGGPDSMFLLEALRELAPGFDAALVGVAHFNHKWRGAESDEDEKFVAEAASEQGIPFHRGEACVSGGPGNLEEAARRARRNFFEKLIQDGAGDRIATGHTLDDQAETVLFRILRGAGPAGIAGILPVTPPGLIRPLLGVTRVEVEQHLRSRGIEWREDSSNRDLRFARNRIRHGLLPELAREWNPRIAQALARAAEVAWAEEIWWETEVRRMAQELLLESEGGVEAEAAKIASLPKALARRLIRHIAASGARRAGLDFEHVERALELAAGERGEGEVALPGLRVLRSFAWVRFETAPRRSRGTGEPRPCSVPGRHPWGDGHICLGVAGPDQRRGNCVSLKLRGISELSPLELAPLELRGWKAGDRYRPALGSREYTIHELFQRARVPSWRRHVWPVICMGPKILWVRQFGAAAEFAARQEGPALRIWEEKECPVGESVHLKPASN